MFTIANRVPYITADVAAKIAEAAPNLYLLVNIPIIEDAVTATVHATEKVKRSLVKHEYISEVARPILDIENGVWNTIFTIRGD